MRLFQLFIASTSGLTTFTCGLTASTSGLEAISSFDATSGVPASTSGLDEVNRERRDLLGFNRHTNNIFNHRHMGGPRSTGYSKFIISSETPDGVIARKRLNSPSDGLTIS